MYTYKRILLVSLMLTLSLIGSVAADCPVGDLDGDCHVNLGDLQVLAGQWLDSSGGSADLNGDDRIDTGDFALLAENWREGSPLIISEFMANKGSSLTTRVEALRQPGVFEYVRPDWIEIYNISSQTLDLEGWYLTDDENNLSKWQMPAMIVGAGQYKVIFASEREQKHYPANYPYLDSNGYYHANFELGRGGEYLALVRPDGLTVAHDYAPQYPDQRGFVSYGYCSETSEYGYFMNPTPGAENEATCITSVVEDTKFSRDRGFYDTDFHVAITTATPGATIHYTTDGSTPTESHGNTYTGPVHVTTTTCLRAIAFKDGYLTTNVDTQTYIFLDDVLAQDGAGFPNTWGNTEPTMKWTPPL